MPGKFFFTSVFAILVMLLPQFALASGAAAKVSYKDGKKQVFKLNRSASLVRRIMFDRYKSKDRLVVTYRDDTHQVFVLKKKLSLVKRLVFEGEAARVASPQLPSRTYNAARDTGLTLHNELGRTWKVTERCAGQIWSGTWTRRGSSNIFDAFWESNSGGKLNSVVELREVSNNKMSLYRIDKNGYYEATLSQDGKRIINGWATWYAPNCMPWFAVID